MTIKIKRYLIEMANDIREKIQDDANRNHQKSTGTKYMRNIDRAIWNAKAGFTTNIETISEILAAYDDYILETCEGC